MEKQQKTLYIIRGLPGSGKTTLAESVAPCYVEADMYHERLKDGELFYDWKPENVRASHEWCYDQIKGMMEMGEDKVAVSNTFTREKEFKNYVELAKEMGYRYFVITVENYHGGVNTHNVPSGTLEAMEERYTLRLSDKTVPVAKTYTLVYDDIYSEGYKAGESQGYEDGYGDGRRDHELL